MGSTFTDVAAAQGAKLVKADVTMRNEVSADDPLLPGWTSLEAHRYHGTHLQVRVKMFMKSIDASVVWILDKVRVDSRAG